MYDSLLTPLVRKVEGGRDVQKILRSPLTSLLQRLLLRLRLGFEKVFSDLFADGGFDDAGVVQAACDGGGGGEGCEED